MKNLFLLKNNKFKFILFFFLFLINQNCFSQNWQCVATGEDGAKYFLDKKKLINENGLIKGWMKIEYDDDKIERHRIFMINKFNNAGVKVEGYENYKYTIEYLVLDCYGNKYKFPIKRDYDVFGRIIWSYDGNVNSDPFREIVPNSMMEGVSQKICK